MKTFFLIMVFTTLGSVVSVSLAAVFLIVPSKIRQRIIPILVSYAAGTLLGAAFIGMLPKALTLGAASPARIMQSLLIGIVLFFVLEKFVLWRHCHKPDCQVHNAAGPIILFGDALHNFTDGIVIASTFIVSIPAGIVASIAVIAHEVPQEIGDFALLIDYGYTRQKAYIYNLISSATALLGAVVGYFALKSFQSFVPYVLTFSAASFVYIALADILPGLNKKSDLVSNTLQLTLMLAGIATIILIKSVNH
jgi:zinc and cadmium transporter